jgi:hypothetical protein
LDKVGQLVVCRVEQQGEPMVVDRVGQRPPVDLGVDRKGHTRRTILIDLVRSMRPYVAELKLATDQELEHLFTDAVTHLENPDTIVMPNLLFLVSGRKPQTS